MAMSEHIAKAFDADLQEITRLVAEMGGLAEKQIAESVDALARRDPDRAQEVVATDARTDALQREIEDKTVLTIARRQPVAVELRNLVGALRLSNDLERIGDGDHRCASDTSTRNAPAEPASSSGGHRFRVTKRR